MMPKDEQILDSADELLFKYFLQVLIAFSSCNQAQYMRPANVSSVDPSLESWMQDHDGPSWFPPLEVETH